MAKKIVQRLLHDSDQNGMGIINIPDEIKRKGGKAWLTVNAQGKEDVTPSAWHSEFSPEDWEDFKKNLNDNGRGITKVWIDDEEDDEDEIDPNDKDVENFDENFERVTKDVDKTGMSNEELGKLYEERKIADELADFQKSLDDYAAKNKKGRDDIPVTTRR